LEIVKYRPTTQTTALRHPTRGASRRVSPTMIHATPNATFDDQQAQGGSVRTPLELSWFNSNYGVGTQRHQVSELSNFGFELT